MYTGIYRCIDLYPGGAEAIFDVSMRHIPHNEVPWEMVAVARIPDGVEFQTYKDASTTHFLMVDGKPVYAMDILLGKAGPLIVWHRGVVPQGGVCDSQGSATA